MFINPIDRNALRAQVRESKPFPNFKIDNFLDEGFAKQLLAAFPPIDDSLESGKSFHSVPERNKFQPAGSRLFIDLNQAIASPEFLDTLGDVFKIPNLLADPELIGGGIQQTGPRGHLDVHVDINYIRERQLHRRLNILIYFNKDWKEEWGGNIELWDKDVKICGSSYAPLFNRCIVFLTNEISYHGVSAVTCPSDRTRKAFGAFYYTKEAPESWTGEAFSPIFKARPAEFINGAPLTSLQPSRRRWSDVLTRIKRGLMRTSA